MESNSQGKPEPRDGGKRSKALIILLEFSDPAESDAAIRGTQTSTLTLFESFSKHVSLAYNHKSAGPCNGESKDDSEVPALVGTGSCEPVHDQQALLTLAHASTSTCVSHSRENTLLSAATVH